MKLKVGPLENDHGEEGTTTEWDLLSIFKGNDEKENRPMFMFKLSFNFVLTVVGGTDESCNSCCGL